MNRDDARAVKDALGDPIAVCAALGLGAAPKDRQRQGGGLTVRCPGHGGVSCSVTRGADRTLRVKCFGCDLAGDVFSLIAAAHKLDARRDFAEVLRIGAELAGQWEIVERIEGRRREPHERRPPVAPAPPVAPIAEEAPKIDADTFDRLAIALLQLCPLRAEGDVCAYLEGRKLLDLAHDAGWGALPSPDRQGAVLERLRAEVGDDAVRRSGLVYVDEEGASTFRKFVFAENRVIIPYRAPGISGIVTTIQRRMIREPLDGKREQKFVFPKGRPARFPYLDVTDLEELGDDTAIAIVEGAPDTVALRFLLRERGLNAMAMGIPGVKSWRTGEELAGYVVGMAKGRHVRIALDADKAGEEAIAPIASALHGVASKVSRFRPKNGKDWADALSEATA